MFECARGIRLMIFLYCMAQHDSSCHRLKSGSSLNSSWRIMMFQPKLLNNTLDQASQQEAPCTTKLTLANPIIPHFQKGPFCKGPGKVRHAFFLLLINMLFYSQFPSLTYDILFAFYTFFFSPKKYFLGFSISKGKEMLPSQKLLSLVC